MAKGTRRTQLISIVVPCFNEQGNIDPLLKEITKHLQRENYEIIFVDDGSTDQSLETLKAHTKKDKRVHYVSFSRNFGHQAALRAGLVYAKGNAVISMDADLQHPASILPDLIGRWREGYEVVSTIRAKNPQATFFKSASSSLFYRLINYLTDLHIEEGTADFRLLDRKVVDVINQQQESRLFLRGYIHWLGFKYTSISYQPGQRFSGSPKYSFKKMLSLAENGITQFSTKPLRVAYGFAAAAFGASFLYAGYAVWVALFKQERVQGWASIVILFVFLQGIQFLMIGLNGEYVGRTFMQTKKRPEFIISETDNEI